MIKEAELKEYQDSFIADLDSQGHGESELYDVYKGYIQRYLGDVNPFQYNKVKGSIEPLEEYGRAFRPIWFTSELFFNAFHRYLYSKNPDMYDLYMDYLEEENDENLIGYPGIMPDSFFSHYEGIFMEAYYKEFVA